jgi:hypothetical protein
MFQPIADFYRFATIALCISVPLALWKVVDIIIWIARNVRVVIG